MLKEVKIIHHRNVWSWGKSIICITNNGYGTATLSITKELEPDGDDCKFVDQAIISGISVYYKYRRQGYGDLLLRECEDEAIRQGFDTVYLWAESNSPAMEWYERRGYVKCPELCIIPTDAETSESGSLIRMKKEFPKIEEKL